MSAGLPPSKPMTGRFDRIASDVPLTRYIRFVQRFPMTVAGKIQKVQDSR